MKVLKTETFRQNMLKNQHITRNLKIENFLLIYSVKRFQGFINTNKLIILFREVEREKQVFARRLKIHLSTRKELCSKLLRFYINFFNGENLVSVRLAPRNCVPHCSTFDCIARLLSRLS